MSANGQVPVSLGDEEWLRGQLVAYFNAAADEFERCWAEDYGRALQTFSDGLACGSDGSTP